MLSFPLKAQLVWIKAGNQPLTDVQLSKVSPLTSLTRLALEHTEITDQGIVALKSLTSLQHLNLNYTKVTAAGVMALATLKNLHTIYLYGTNIKPEEMAGLNRSFPATHLELGNYVVPALPTDTVEVK